MTKKTIFKNYVDVFVGNEYVSLYEFPMNVESNYWLYLLLPKDGYLFPKESVINKALSYGLELRPFFYLLSEMDIYSSFYSQANEYNNFLSKYGICLPYSLNLTRQTINKIAQIITRVYRELDTQ